MALPDIAEFINRVGFPVFVGVYVLVRLEPTINKLSDNLRLLTVLLARQQGMTDEEVEKVERQFGLRKER